MELVSTSIEKLSFVTQNEQLLKQKISTLETKVNEINESIRYASIIQQAILPNMELFLNSFDDAFVFNEPKDLLSGDFYWYYRHKNSVYFAVGDCTGHGVPGALVNMAANSFLQQIIKQKGIYNPSKIIELLDKEISSCIKQ